MLKYLPWILVIGFGALIWWLESRFSVLGGNEMARADLTQMLIMAVLVTSGSALLARENLSRNLKYGLVWILIILVLVLGYAQKDTLLAALVPQSARVGEDGSLEFQRAVDGHFYVEALVNNVPVKFMVDTGASEVVLSPNDAKRAGYDPASLEYSKIFFTANGQGKGAPVIIESFIVGDLEEQGMRASVNGAAMDSSLLGMSYLSRFRSMELKGDRLLLRR